MRARYYSQRNSDGGTWTVFDRTTKAPAETNGRLHDAVPGEDVDELVDMLNGVEARQKTAKKASRLSMAFRRDRYFAKRDPDGDGWSVYDNTTGAVAEVSGSGSTGLAAEDADEIVDMLNRIEKERG